MKKEFEKVEIEVIRFEEKDVIATSGDTPVTQDVGAGEGTAEGDGTDLDALFGG